MRFDPAMMRAWMACFAASLLSACGGGGGGSSSSGGGGKTPPQPVTFQLTSPEIPVASGQEALFCYHFELPVSSEIFIKQWSATFGTGVKNMWLILPDAMLQPAGTVTLVNEVCNQAKSPVALLMVGQTATVPATWAFSAYRSGEEFTYPDNDGNGLPVGLRVKARQPAVMMVHVHNQTNDTSRPTVTLSGASYPVGSAVTRAESFVGAHGLLNLQPGQQRTESATCATPPGAKVFSLTMRTHYLATAAATSVAGPNGPINLFEKTYSVTDNRFDPGIRRFTAPAFATFINDQVTYACSWSNTTNSGVGIGDRLTRDEQCMTIAQFFPATQPVGCYNFIQVP